MTKEYNNVKEVDISKLMNSNISHTTIPTPIDTIISRLESGFYYIPDYQRRYVWEKKQIVALIISLIKDIPIPKLYMYNNQKDKKYTIIDGQQRLTSLFFFVKGVYPSSNEERRGKYNFNEISTLINKINDEGDKLKKEEYKQELLKKHGLILEKYKYKNENGESISFEYKNFKDEDKLVFLNKTFEFGAVFVKDDSEKINTNQIYTDIFRLLNSAGTPLSNQEIRNGIYYDTKLYKKINEFNRTNINWNIIKNITFKSDREVRYENIEFLLRLIALDEYIKVSSKKKLIEYIKLDNFNKIDSEVIKLDKYKTYSELIDKLSSEFIEEDVDNKILKLKNFFDGIEIKEIKEIKELDESKAYPELIDKLLLESIEEDVENKILKLKNFFDEIEIKEKIKTLNIEAYFLAYSKMGLLENTIKLPCEMLQLKSKSSSKTSSKKEILKRILEATKCIVEKRMD